MNIKKYTVLIVLSFLASFGMAGSLSEKDLLGSWKASKVEAFGSTTEFDESYFLVYTFTEDGRLVQEEHDNGKIGTLTYKYQVIDSKLMVNTGFTEVHWGVSEKTGSSLVIKDPVTTVYLHK